MKRVILLTLVAAAVFVCTPAIGGAQDDSFDDAAGSPETVAGVVVVPEGDATAAETAVPAPPDFRDERVVAVEAEAQSKIQAVLEQIGQLEDRSEEGELQKTIEQMKLDAEIERLRIQLEQAEQDEDAGLTVGLQDEIEHLENINQPVIGYVKGQPVQ